MSVNSILHSINRIVSTLILSLAIMLPNIVSVSAGSLPVYMTPDKAMRDAKRMRNKGMYPKSLSCKRDKTKKFFKPIVKVNWQKNTRNVEWELMAYKGQLEFIPGSISSKTKWRRVSRHVIPSGGVKFFCLLYYKR